MLFIKSYIDKCPICEGSGKSSLPSHRDGDCNYCKGSGKIKVLVYHSKVLNSKKESFILSSGEPSDPN